MPKLNVQRSWQQLPCITDLHSSHLFTSSPLPCSHSHLIPLLPIFTPSSTQSERTSPFLKTAVISRSWRIISSRSEQESILKRIWKDWRNTTPATFYVKKRPTSATTRWDGTGSSVWAGDAVWIIQLCQKREPKRHTGISEEPSNLRSSSSKRIGPEATDFQMETFIHFPDCLPGATRSKQTFCTE